MFIAEAPPENQAPSGAACRIGEQTNGSMPLLTELAEIVVGCGSYKHAAPTELVGSRRRRCYKHADPDGVVGRGPSGIVAAKEALDHDEARFHPSHPSSVVSELPALG